LQAGTLMVIKLFGLIYRHLMNERRISATTSNEKEKFICYLYLEFLQE
jgi:hypothetical protein